MKILVAGSRTINPVKLVATFSMLLNTYSPSVFISGCAEGVDQLPWLFNHMWKCDIPIAEYPVTEEDWETFGKAAGPMRNELMAMECDAAIVIWDGKSPGTKSMLKFLDKYKKPYILWKV